MKKNNTGLSLSAIAIAATILFFTNISLAQGKSPYVRIVNLVIKPNQLEGFKAALKKDIETAVRTEPGVLTLYAVYEEDAPNNVTLFEIYANEDAHKAHMQTSHFKKYKDTVKDMVASTVRKNVIPIGLETKPK